MRQYEIVWRSKNKKYYERTRDTETNEVHIKEFNPKFEFFEECDNSEYKFILDQNTSLKRKTFYNEKEYREYSGVLDSVGKKIYGYQQPIYNHIRENFFGNGVVLTPRIWHLDIEVIGPQGSGFPDPIEANIAVTSFQIYDSFSDTNILIISKALNDEKAFLERNPKTVVKTCTDEKQMFEVFAKLLDYMKPSIITAWNGEQFDIPYITNRAKKIEGFNYRRLSPINVINERNVNDNVIYEWEGITLVDLMIAYKEFTYTTQTSYSLDNIANVELGVGNGKVDYSGYKNIIEFCEKDYDTFMDYAIKDIQITKQLDDKLNLINLIIMLSTMMGINPSDAFGTVKPWGVYLTNVALERKLVMPKDEKHHLDSSITGGYVADPQTGLWKWLASIDVDSEYPLLGIVAHNMSAETYIPYTKLPQDARDIYDKWCSDENEEKFLSSTGMNPETDEIKQVCRKYNMSFGMNAFFSNEKLGLLPELVNDIYNTRKISKMEMLTYKALLTKIKSTQPGNESNIDIYKLIDDGKLTLKNLEELKLEFSAIQIEDFIKKFPSKIAYWNTHQMVLKILINSLYGALSNQYFVLFNRDIAASITGNGRIFIRGVSNYINYKLNKMFKISIDNIIYNDTDSSYFRIDHIVDALLTKFDMSFDEMDTDTKKEFLDLLLKFIDKYINKWVDEFIEIYADKFNSFNPDVIGAKLEKIMDRGIFVAKKRYTARAIYDEGDILLESPKISVTGLETVRSSTPAFCRQYLKDALGHLMSEDELFIQDFIYNVKSKFMNADITDISRVSGVSNLDYDFDGIDNWKHFDGTKYLSAPIASRASLVHNKFISELGLQNEYELINESDKIKYVFLTLPNKVNSNVFGYKDENIINKLGLQNNLDKELMFEKFFIQPMKIILDAMNYQVEKKTNVDEWF